MVMCLLYLPSTKDYLNFGIGIKSLYISHKVTNFYGTEIEIWAGFGPVGNTEKIILGRLYEQLLRAVFSCFQGQKIFNFFQKYCNVRAKKLHNIFFIYFFKISIMTLILTIKFIGAVHGQKFYPSWLKSSLL